MTNTRTAIRNPAHAKILNGTLNTKGPFIEQDLSEVIASASEHTKTEAPDIGREIQKYLLLTCLDAVCFQKNDNGMTQLNKSCYH